jgi:uncharacterized protein YaeQ
MAIGASIYHFAVELSDVDRGQYASLDLRLARHPSESLRYLLTRTLAYCLCHAPGIGFSKGGLSDAAEPPVSIRDAGGNIATWIDVGAPSAKRLHKASKSAEHVVLFTHVERELLLKEARSSHIHRLGAIQVWPIEQNFLSQVEAKLSRKLQFSLTRSDATLYLELAGETLHTSLVCSSLSD